MLAAYGRTCVHCGSSEDLHFHHLEGDGEAHRLRKGGTSAATWADLKALGFPPVMQPECAQCHRAGHAYACLGGNVRPEWHSDDDE